MVAEHRRLHVSRRRFVQGAGLAGRALQAGCQHEGDRQWLPTLRS
jgi:hypothetical protein